MGYYVGLDVSLKSTHICVLDGERRVVWRGVLDTQIAMIAEDLPRWSKQIVLVGVETGSLTPSPRGLSGPGAVCATETLELVARTADGTAQTDKVLALSPEDVLRLLHIFDAGKPVAIMSEIRNRGRRGAHHSAGAAEADGTRCRGAGHAFGRARKAGR